MANLLSINSGSFTSSSTWGVLETNSFQNSYSTSTTVAIGTSLTSNTFTISSNTTVSGICLMFSSVSAVAGVTYTVDLLLNGTSVSGTAVTINSTDLPTYAGFINAGYTLGTGWTYFSFSPVAISAGSNYAIRIRSSSSTTTSMFYLTSTSNFSKALLTTTTQAPTTGDNLIVAGQYSSAGINNQITVTVNTNDSNVYGSGTTGSIALHIGNKGNVTYATTGTNSLILAGSLQIAAGSLIIGSSTSPITGTANLTINCSSNPTTTSTQFIILIDGGTFSTYGASKTTTAKLAADVAVSDSTSTTDISTGWKNGDQIAVPSTSATSTQYEIVTLNSDASGTSLSHSGYSYAHGGNATTFVQAGLGNLTRNIIIRSSQDSYPTSMYGFVNATLSFYYTQFIGFGIINSNSPYCAIYCQAVTKLDMRYSSMYINPANTNTLNVYGIGCDGARTFNIMYFNNNVVYGYNVALNINAVSKPSITEINYNLFCRGSMVLAIPNANITNNEIASCASFGMQFSSNAITYSFGNISNNILHSNTTFGIDFSFLSINLTNNSILFSQQKIWRNGTFGINLNTVSRDNQNIIKFDTCYLFGNVYHIGCNGTLSGNIIFTSCFFWGGTTITTTALFGTTTNFYNGIRFADCTFGKDPSGNVSLFSTAMFIMGSAIGRQNNITLYNSTIGTGMVEAVFTSGRGGIIDNNLGVVSLKHNGVSDSHKMWTQTGVISTDTTSYSGSTPPTIRITPSTSAYKTTTNLYRIPITTGASASISVNLRKSVVGDGTAYNGNPPRLMYRYNPHAGNYGPTGATGTDIQCYVSSATAGTWETMSYTTATVSNDCVLEFYIDCDGTAGWINYVGWLSSVSNDTRGTKFWTSMQGPYIELSYNATYSPPNGFSNVYIR